MIEDTLSYLLTGSNSILPSSYVKLRSYLNTHSANLAEHHQIQIFKKNTQCPYCYSSWDRDVSSFKLLPTRSLKTRRLEKPNEGTTNGKCKNILALKCKVCKERSVFFVKKKSIEKKVQTVEEKSVKKKKRKKDKSSGLLVNLKSTNEFSLPVFRHKKNDELVTAENNGTGNSVQIKENNSKKPQVKTPINFPSKLPQKNNLNLVRNPFASLEQEKFSRKKGQKLKQLKKAVKENDNIAKKTLKDFLTLI